MSDDTYAIVYDCKLRRPGCVLLQAAMGGTVPPDLFASLFDDREWLLAPTDDLRVYRATRAQLDVIAAKSKEARRG